MKIFLFSNEVYLHEIGLVVCTLRGICITCCENHRSSFAVAWGTIINVSWHLRLTPNISAGVKNIFQTVCRHVCSGWHRASIFSKWFLFLLYLASYSSVGGDLQRSPSPNAAIWEQWFRNSCLVTAIVRAIHCLSNKEKMKITLRFEELALWLACITRLHYICMYSCLFTVNAAIC